MHGIVYNDDRMEHASGLFKRFLPKDSVLYESMYLTEMEYEKDMERMKQYYPAETKEIMELVEQRLDQLEYEGSRIYDEEPDRLMIQMEIDGIYRKLSEVQKKKENRIEGNMQAASYFEMVPASIAGETMTTQERECGNPWLCSMIGVLFGAEMCKRRCRHRRCRRWM